MSWYHISPVLETAAVYPAKSAFWEIKTPAAAAFRLIIALVMNTPPATPPVLVAGLGNPGATYAQTRHNAGFWLIDALADNWGMTWRGEKKFHGDITGTECRLLRPMTMMNNSGRAVAAVCNYFRIPPQQVLVAHDEADLPPGEVKLKFGGGNAGHNGLADISHALGSRDYWRLRLGVGRVPGDIANYVLANAPTSEKQAVDDAIKRVLELWPHINNGDWQTAMQLLHTSEKDNDLGKDNAPEKDNSS